MNRLVKLSGFICIFLSHTLSASEFTLPQECYVSGDYRQEKTIPGINSPLVSDGSFIFDCTVGLIWYTDTPTQETFIYKSKGKNQHLDNEGVLTSLKSRVHKHLGKLLVGLIGADEAYLNKYFEQSSLDSSLRLIPKKKRMKKFVSQIEISQSETETSIQLSQAKKQTSQINISNTQIFSSFNIATCQKTFKHHDKACQYLYSDELTASVSKETKIANSP